MSDSDSTVQESTPTPYGHYDYSGDVRNWIPDDTSQALKGRTATAFDPSQVAYSANVNYQGMPTEYYDQSGNMIGYWGRDDAPVSTSGYNFVDNAGNPMAGPQDKRSYYQQTDNDGNLLFVNPDYSEGSGASQYTVRDTGIPAYGQLAQNIKMNAPSPGLLQDPLFRNFMLSAAAMGGAAALAPAMGGSGAGLGAAAEAFPVTGGSLIPATELGAAGLGTEAGLGAAAGAGLVDTGAGIVAPGTGAALNGAEAGSGLMDGIGTWAAKQTAGDWLKYGLGAVTAAGALGSLSGSGSGSGGSSGSSGAGSAQPGMIRPYAYKQVKNPNYTGAGTPYFLQSYQPGTPYSVGMAAGGIAALGGQNTMYPMSQIDHTQYATPSQMPTSAEVVNSGYETKVNPYTGAEQLMARGGIATLGSYSDGGRLLKGPGDGVSDDIPAQIGDMQPARLADGEFVIPARIVSELGNGSTDAGAKRLYAMMERVQAGRGKTTGKNKVAVDSKSYKHLPA